MTIPREIPETKSEQLNIVTPGTYGVFSNLSDASIDTGKSPYLYSGSFGNCVGFAIRWVDNNKIIAVLTHFFASSKSSLKKSFEDIFNTMAKHGYKKDDLKGFSCIVFTGEKPNKTSEQLVEQLTSMCISLGTKANVIKGKYPNVLFNAITGEIMSYQVSQFSELRKRGLLVAAASGDSTAKSSDPIRWNHSINDTSEPSSQPDVKIVNPTAEITVFLPKQPAPSLALDADFLPKLKQKKPPS